MGLPLRRCALTLHSRVPSLRNFHSDDPRTHRHGRFCDRGVLGVCGMLFVIMEEEDLSFSSSCSLPLCVITLTAQ